MKKIGYIIFGFVLMALIVSTGCEKLGKMENTVDKALTTAEGAAPIADPYTNGWASTAVKILGAVAGAVFAVNRTFVARSRKKAILEMDDFHGSPAATQQVHTASAAKAVYKITKRG